MVKQFEVGKTYRYTGKIGDPTPFVVIGIDEQDARFIVSGKPLVCTYVEKGYCPDVGFKGMNHEKDGWAFITLYDLFEEVKETPVAKEKQKEKQKEEKKEMPKFEVGKKYHYTGSLCDSFDFTRIGIDEDDAEYIASGKPLTVEWSSCDNRIKFEEFKNPWSFLNIMLEKFEEVTAPVATYAERQSKWVKDNNIVRGSKVRLLRSYEPNEEGYVTEYPYSGTKTKKHPIGQVFRVCYADQDMGIVLAPTDDEFECNIGNYFPYFVLEKVADDTPVYGEPVAPPKASYLHRQTEWVTQNDVKAGTKVRVTRIAKDNEDGWNNGWVGQMNNYVGKVGTVMWGLDTPYGLSIKFEEGGTAYGYPFFVLEVVKDTPAPTKSTESTKSAKSVKEFETGKWYVCHLTERPADWNPSGKMDALLDGKPHKCTFGKGHLAEFEGMPQQGDGGWNFWSDLEYFEEVPAPSSEVDWQKKYTELKRKAIAMLSAYGDASKSFREELEAL